MNTENNKTNEPNKFIYLFMNLMKNLILKTQITKILDWLT